MRMYSTLIAGLAGFALAAGASSSQAQDVVKSWGPKHTTYWSSTATGNHDPGKFMDSTMQLTAQPGVTQVQYQPQMRQQRMYYQQPTGKRTRAQMRVRQQQPGMRPGQPPAERSDQPPPNTSPGAPPTNGQPPARGQQPMNQGQQPK